jgi:hypothetical protein
MSLERFKSAFRETSREGNSAQCVDFGVPGLGALSTELGGATFDHGLYRVLRAEQVPIARSTLEAVFPEYRGRIVPFGFDWLGRHFASDLLRVQNGQPLVLMLEVGAGEAMEIPATLFDFHNVELVDYRDDALAAKFWNQWRNLNPAALAFKMCVGYKVPLFLGGADVIDNLEVQDTDVYIEICGQLRNKVRTLQPSQSVTT